MGGVWKERVRKMFFVNLKVIFKDNIKKIFKLVKFFFFYVKVMW